MILDSDNEIVKEVEETPITEEMLLLNGWCVSSFSSYYKAYRSRVYKGIILSHVYFPDKWILENDSDVVVQRIPVENYMRLIRLVNDPHTWDPIII